MQGKTEKSAQKILNDAKAVVEAGAFAVTLECVPESIAAQITESTDAITIGIGAGNKCDGQVLVWQDMAGYSNGFVPKFVKQYANIHDNLLEAFKQYKEEVANHTFPDKEHTFH